MKYSRNDAKAYARQHLRGIWAAAQTPFKPDLAIDEAGLRRNLRHWVDDLGIDGVFVTGKQGEFFSMSLAERKRTFEIAVDEIGGARTILSCSDQNLEHRDRAGQARAGDRLRLHRRARAGAAFPQRAGRDADGLLPRGQRAGRHRHRAVEPSRLRLPDEPGAVRARRRAAERGRDQIQRAARDVCEADAARRRQADRQHRVRGRVVRQHRRARLAALSLLVAALRLPDRDRPPHARLHRPRVQRRRRARQGGARQPRSGARGVQAHAAAGKIPRAFEILAGAARPGRRRRAAAAAGADRGREGRDAARVRELRAQAAPACVRRRREINGDSA